VIGQPAAPGVPEAGARVEVASEGAGGEGGSAEPEYLAGPPLYWRLLAANLFVVLGGAVIGTALTRQFVLSGSFTLLTGTLMVVVAMSLSAILTGAILQIAFRPLRELRQAIEQSPPPGDAAPAGGRKGGLEAGSPDRYGDPDILAVSRAVRGLWDRLDQHVRLMAESNRRLEEQRRELAEKTVQLQQLAGLVLAAQEDERRRVARELHDETMQSMAALLMGLEGILQALPEGEPQLRTARQSMVRLRDLAARTLDELRHLALDLRPSVLDDHGLVAAVRWLAETLTERTGLPCRVTVGGDLSQGATSDDGEAAGETRASGRTARRLPPAAETALFRITQEALANVAKHAQASHVGVRLVQTATAVAVQIEDDGVGLPVGPDGLPAAPDSTGHMGLFNMRERAALLGGTCTIRRRRGARGTRGTVVRAEVPLPMAEPAEPVPFTAERGAPAGAGAGAARG
jgi:two-component system sensor histidine kinase UhpB